MRWRNLTTPIATCQGVGISLLLTWGFPSVCPRNTRLPCQLATGFCPFVCAACLLYLFVEELHLARWSGQLHLHHQRPLTRFASQGPSLRASTPPPCQPPAESQPPLLQGLRPPACQHPATPALAAPAQPCQAAPSRCLRAYACQLPWPRPWPTRYSDSASLRQPCPWPQAGSPAERRARPRTSRNHSKRTRPGFPMCLPTNQGWQTRGAGEA
mmetsp:Transcript_44186/g.96123  ORF Transcript_44186/g.96123 Transcript_44186/m.96123 type:complete len:213 (+) Transcript_44186:65-703(+)